MSDQAEQDFVAAGCRHDAPDIAALAREALPSFPALHDEEGWRTFYRFGNGAHPRDNYLLVVRDGSESGPLAGFVWAEPALATDHGLQEPWWCINAVVVAPFRRRCGLGSALVGAVAERGREVGVTQVYGLSVGAAVPFWRSVGLTVAANKEPLVADRPARSRTGDRISVHLDPQEDHRWFVGNLVPPADAVSMLVPQTQLPALG